MRMYATGTLNSRTGYLLGWLMWCSNPDISPLLLLVLRGGKGDGKSSVFNILGHCLLGDHYAVESTNRTLTSSFNDMLRETLLINFEEAFWSGHKAMEGMLKELITGESMLYEPKGRDRQKGANLTRVGICGNEEWLVPASADERRFCVIDVTSRRRQQKQWFIDMRNWMLEGGAPFLLRYLMELDISEIDVGTAPKTLALIDQMKRSLPVVDQWWLDCLHGGMIAGEKLADKWPGQISIDRLYGSLAEYKRQRGIRGTLIARHKFARKLRMQYGATPSVLDSGVVALLDLNGSRGFFEKNVVGRELDWDDE